MVILEVTVYVLGRFKVLDDYSIEEVSFLPTTGAEEIEWVQERLQLGASAFSDPVNVLANALRSTYGLDEDDYTVHISAGRQHDEGTSLGTPVDR